MQIRMTFQADGLYRYTIVLADQSGETLRTYHRQTARGVARLVTFLVAEGHTISDEERKKVEGA